jgi:hypothetical protein
MSAERGAFHREQAANLQLKKPYLASCQFKALIPEYTRSPCTSCAESEPVEVEAMAGNGTAKKDWSERAEREFSKFFKTATTFEPYPYQTRLALRTSALTPPKAPARPAWRSQCTVS